MSLITRLAICRILFGALLAVPIGYFLYAVAEGAGGGPVFSVWLTRTPSNPLEWAIVGAIMGALWHAIRQLDKNSN